ncbi:MAG: substrate-binding domain-containing protein [Anaerolineales bacterium]|nr:substrate-binding domain-containing protein [Anaerolineales bacterium]
MPVTIRDVARTLNLSVTTVSRALAGHDDVAEATRQRVVETAREMGYVPSHAARQLRRQRTETIGLIFPTLGSRFSDPFFSEFMAGIGDEASRCNHDLLVSVAPPGEEEETTYKRWVNSRRVDGFVLVRMRVHDWRIQYLTEAQVPFVAFGRSRTSDSFPHIGVDGGYGMCALVEHLVTLGHHRIAFIGAPSALTLAQDRLNGYRRGLQAAELPFDPTLVIEENLTRTGGYRAALTLLQYTPRPSAIIGANDLTALGAIRAAQERQLTVGRDIAIAGFDGIEAGEHTHPPLTTVHQPVYEIGGMVSEMLIRRIQRDPLEQEQVLLKPTLVVRQSCGAAFQPLTKKEEGLLRKTHR